MRTPARPSGQPSVADVAPRRRWARRLAGVTTALLALPLFVGVIAAAPAVASTTSATTSASHPFSMPVWFPIHDETYLDCVYSNPGCSGTHDHWTMDMVLETLDGSVPRDPGVYAMGAGILHIENAHGRACRNGGTADFGTSVWIDHGGGIVSRYGHLSRILYKSGTRLAAGQEFAIMGTTGKNTNCSVPYLDFQVRYHGIGGPTEHTTSLRVCSSATTSTYWPSALNAREHIRPAPEYSSSRVRSTYSSFNDVPQRTVDFPATTGDCIPGSVPATPNTPSGVHLAATGRHRMTVTWTTAPSTPQTTSVQVQLSQYHPSTHTWDYTQNEQYVSVSPGWHQYSFPGTVSGHKYRATVVFRNGSGYSPSTTTGAVTSVGAPSTPSARRAYVTRSHKYATLHFGWNRPKNYGLPATGFQVQQRRLFAHHASKWVTVHLSSRLLHWARAHSHKHARYQLRVRATYHGGVTGYLTRTLHT